MTTDPMFVFFSAFLALSIVQVLLTFFAIHRGEVREATRATNTNQLLRCIQGAVEEILSAVQDMANNPKESKDREWMRDVFMYVISRKALDNTPTHAAPFIRNVRDLLKETKEEPEVPDETSPPEETPGLLLRSNG